MAGVNNVSTTFDNAPENSHNTAVERTATTCTTTNLHHKAADDSDDQDSDSLQNVIDDELSRRLQTETPGGDSAALECAADLQCPPPSAAAADVNHDAASYRVQKDASERMLLTETRHAEETGRLLIGPAIVSDSGPDDKNDNGPPPPPSDGSEDDDVAAVVVPDLAATADPPAADEQRRVFVRPPPADETDNVQTELVFDTWTTADEDAVRESDAPKSETNGFAEECYSDISRAAPNPECFVDVNAPAIVTNAVTEIVSETTSERKTVKKKSLSSAGGGDSSTTTVVKTKKTKKSKKNDEKENISVKSSFGKFDQLEKKAILQQQRSPESEKSDAKQNGVLRSEVNSVCKSCEKTVYAMEQIKAERQVWHKNCFRCTTCNKQLTLDIYSSHEGVLYCKPHFKELFKPKVVVEDEEPTSDKPDLGLEELSSLNVKSRYQAFENATTNGNSSMEKSPVSVKRSPSILSKLAKFQSKGMDVGISNEALNGAFFEPSSSSESGDEDTGNDVMMKNSISKEKPMSFDKMESVKRNWEMRREEMKEEHKQEIQNIRSKLFAGKQGKMKQMYEQAVAESERTGVKRDLNVNKSDKAKVMKERFEKGELLNNEDTELDENNSSVPTNGIDDEMSVFEAGISKKSRSLFMEMDANAVKTKHSAPVVSPKKEYTPTKQVTPIYNRQVSDDVVKSSDRIEDVNVETAEVSSKFKFFETYKPPEIAKKQFRITPPREGQIKGESPERDIYRDPNIVRNEDPVDETAELVKSNTTAKMLSLFRQMEVAKPAVPEGPKPLKCFTPPPDYKESETESETDEDDSGDESGEEDSSSSETNGDVIKSSVKVEDEFLKNAQNAVMARSLKEKFEHWEPDKHSLNNAVTMLDSEQESIESTKSLRARFESFKSDRSVDKPKPKVNRFV